VSTLSAQVPSPRQAGSSLSCQTLGITVASSLLEQAVPSVHAAYSALPLPLYVSQCLANSQRKVTTVSRSSVHRGTQPRNAIFGRVGGFMALCRRFGLFGTLPVSSWLALRAAVLRLAVRALSAAEYGTAGLACVRSPAVPSITWHRPWHPGTNESGPRVMPNLSIERTRPGKPGRASHVKR
jgi:hypothetical protein